MVPSPPKMSAASGWSVGSNSLPENRFTPGRSNRPRWCSLATGPRRATARTALLSHRRHEIQNRDLTRKGGSLANRREKPRELSASSCTRLFQLLIRFNGLQRKQNCGYSSRFFYGCASEPDKERPSVATCTLQYMHLRTLNLRTLKEMAYEALLPASVDSALGDLLRDQHGLGRHTAVRDGRRH